MLQWLGTNDVTLVVAERARLGIIIERELKPRGFRQFLLDVTCPCNNFLLITDLLMAASMSIIDD